jgi:hypothetical protein
VNQRDIHRIGERLCQCQEICAGIKRNQRKGDFPRGIIFEVGEAPGFGTVICGLNPGTAKQAEKDFIFENGRNYAALVKGWEAYRAVTYMFPNRPTLGVPHPTGPYSRFLLFFDSKGNLKNSFKKQILKYFAQAPNGTLWVDPRSTS